MGQTHRYIVPKAQKIFERYAQQLDISDFSFHDEGVSDLKGAPRPQGEYDQIIALAAKMFDEMGDDFGQFFRMLLDRNLMDLQARDGKARGGFCTLISDQKIPFIYANFNGSEGDI